jgi:hypothetical protein
VSVRFVRAQRVNGEIPPQVLPADGNDGEAVCGFVLDVEIVATAEVTNNIINKREIILKW